MEKVITRVERMGVSVYGNPYFRLHFDDGTSARTKIDAMINYSLTNSENLDRPASLKLTRAGRVYDIKALEA